MAASHRRAVVKDDARRVLASFTFKNNGFGISEFVERIAAFKDVKVAVESSGNFWVKLYDAFEGG